MARSFLNPARLLLSASLNAADGSAGDEMAEEPLSDVCAIAMAPLRPVATFLRGGGASSSETVDDSSANSELESGSWAFSTASSCVGLALTLRWPRV